VTLQVSRYQHYLNVIDDVKLEITEYNGRVHLQKERMMYLREPTMDGPEIVRSRVKSRA
jgi:hypothetical protein